MGEHYLPAEAAQGAGHCAKAARAAADQLRREGTRVHHVRSILIPEDETCIHLYRAESIDAVRVAAARALLRLDRLTEAVSDTGAAVRLLLAPVVYLVGVIVLVPVSDPGSARAAQRVIAPLGSFPWPREGALEPIDAAQPKIAGPSRLRASWCLRVVCAGRSVSSRAIEVEPRPASGPAPLTQSVTFRGDARARLEPSDVLIADVAERCWESRSSR